MRLIILASIYTADEANACSVWPSPEQLKGRIIIRVCCLTPEIRGTVPRRPAL